MALSATFQRATLLPPKSSSHKDPGATALLSSGTVGDVTSPPEWPRQLHESLAWTGNDVVDGNTYVRVLTRIELLEIERALELFKALGRPFHEVTKDVFPLVRLGPSLELQARELHRGMGFFILRGLDPSRYSREDNISVFLGISSYIGERRAQQHPDGRMLTHISPPAFEPSRHYHPVFSKARLPFHTDYATDILALYCLSPGSGGGKNIVASSWRIYNELAQTRPDLLKLLAQEKWTITPFDNDANPTTNALLHLNAQGQPILNFSIRNLLFVSPAQREALDAVQALAHEHKLQTPFYAGDMRFINNLAILHSRDALQEGCDGGGDRRHLLRLWLRNKELGWTIPRRLEPDWRATFDGARGRERWALEVMTETELYQNESSKCG